MNLVPSKAFNLIGKSVRVELDVGRKLARKRFADGELLTVDPTSGSVVLAVYQGTDVQRFEMIPGCSVVQLEENIEGENEEINKKIEDILGFMENKDVESKEAIRERCLKIVEYLKSHHIDVVEKAPGQFIIAGIVKFESPYTRDNFYCDIPIVLQRILKLVDQIG